MTTVVCIISVLSMHFYSHATVEGKLISKSDTKYLVDFSEGIKKYQVDDPQDYSEVLVNKLDCVIKK